MTVGKEKILVVQTFKTMTGLDLKTGKQLWQQPTPPERRYYNSATPVIDGQNIMLTGQGLGSKSLRVEKQGDNYTLTENWTFKDLGTSFNTVVLKDGFLYGNDGNMGYLYCLNAKTGEKCWADTTRLDRFAAIVDAGKIMFSMPASKQLIIFKPNSKMFEPVVRYKVSDTPVYAHPVLTKDGFYIKEKELLTYWKFK